MDKKDKYINWINKTIIYTILLILLDLLTTFIGLSIGLTEGNPMGLFQVILINTIVVIMLICYLYFKPYVKIKNIKVIKALLYSILFLGINRLFVATWNIYLISVTLI